jgi:hypothetical protein
MQEFTILDKVKVKDGLPYAGCIAEVVDIYEGKRTGKIMYRVKIVETGDECTLAAVDLEAYEEKHEYRFEFFYDDNVVIVSMYDGDTLIERGHGHIIHSGADGIAQAASYAMKKLWAKLNDKGGDLR